MSTITVVRVDTAGSRARVEGYLADARRTVAGGAAPVIPPPTVDQTEHEPVIPQQEQSQTPKRKRGKLTDDERARLITMFQKGKAINDIVEAFGISKSYAYAVGKSGRCSAKSRGGARNVRLTNEASSILAQELVKKPTVHWQGSCESTQQQRD